MSRASKKSSNLMYEHQIAQQGYRYILGMDEAGRGAWAGPVTVGAVCLPLNEPGLRKLLRDVRDSKEMTPRQRERVVLTIKEIATAWGVGSATNDEVDEHGIVNAVKLAMSRALDDTNRRFPGFTADCLFLDAMIWPEMIDRVPQVTIVDGDARSLTISAASILAKTWRDAHMHAIDPDYPDYCFAAHKGYGTAPHRAALQQYGPCAIHRRTFKPVRACLETDS
jgi:ribonuclease HII